MRRSVFFLLMLSTSLVFSACRTLPKAEEASKNKYLPKVEVSSFQSQDTYPGVESNFRMSKTYVVRLKGDFPEPTEVGGLFHDGAVLHESFYRLNGEVMRGTTQPVEGLDQALELTFSRSFFVEPELEEHPLGGALPASVNFPPESYHLALIAANDTLWLSLGTPVPMEAIYAP